MKYTRAIYDNMARIKRSIRYGSVIKKMVGNVEGVYYPVYGVRLPVTNASGATTYFHVIGILSAGVNDFILCAEVRNGNPGGIIHFWVDARGRCPDARAEQYNVALSIVVPDQSFIEKQTIESIAQA